MTEKKPKASAAGQYFDNPPELDRLPATSMLLMKAGRLAGFDGRTGWPDAFTIEELAALQYPDDKALQGDLIALLMPAVHRGEIDAIAQQHADGVALRQAVAALRAPRRLRARLQL